MNFFHRKLWSRIIASTPLLLGATFCGAAAQPATPTMCDLHEYKALPNLQTRREDDGIVFEWEGEANAHLRARFTLRDSRPLVKELAVQEKGAGWVTLARNLTPEFQVTTGKRRISSAQLALLKKFHTDTPENIEARKWDTFWDAPLVTPGEHDTTDLPRKPEEIRRDTATFRTQKCAVQTAGDRMSVTFDGLTLGLFNGDLRFTVYKGSNLLRQEAIASTTAPSVAFIYRAGLNGFAVTDNTNLFWRDTARQWQKYSFGGAVNDDPVSLRARNRLELLETGGGSIGVFAPPHKFFFARENEVNLGYVYYRKDRDDRGALGVMQPDRSEGYHPWGVADDVWNRRVGVSHTQWENFALYNAPPNTQQHMAIYYYLSGRKATVAQESVLAYTHNDVFKPVPGFKVVSGHFHLDFNENLRDRGSLDFQPPWVSVFRGIGVNILYLGDFHDDSHPTDPGPIRFKEQKVYFEGAQRVSDKNFLVIPAEEVNSYLGGHWYLMTPRPIYFSHAVSRPAGSPLIEKDPQYGQVYHLASTNDVMEMVNREKGIMWTAHPRTKNSEGYPDAYKDQDFFLSDRFIGASWESLPVDLSEQRLCEKRCFGTGDDMSNWAPKPKSLIAEGDTYMKWPDDETYPQLAVNYLKLDRVPRYDESWAPVTEGIRAGNFFGTTGEVLFHRWGIQGSGVKSAYDAEIEYTFPLEFAELVWSDGSTVSRKIIDLKDALPFGTRKFHIPFDATGKKWIRFAVWDSAGNGAYVQPIAPH